MKLAYFAVAIAALALSGLAQAAPAPSAPLAAPSRPAADREQDARRKAAEILAFAELRPGQRVADVFPGGGYFARIFAAGVGPQGRVYGVTSPIIAERFQPKADPAVSNYSIVSTEWHQFRTPDPLDLIFISQFYHDLYTPAFGGAQGVAPINRAMFDALKPGGILLVIDHSGRAGTGVSEVGSLHRIEDAGARRELTTAGFVYEDALEALRNPQDPRTANVFDPSIRGRTDQFILKFRKPAR